MVLTVDRRGRVVPHVSVAGADFERGTTVATGGRGFAVADVVRLPDGDWFAVGGADVPVGLRSADGSEWETVPLTGFEAPAEIHDVAVVDGTVVVAGSYRRAKDPSMGGFEAHVWTSDDATDFTTVDLPGVVAPKKWRNESYAGSLAVVDGRLLVSGRVDDHAVVWTSDDLAVWEQADVLAASYNLTGLAVVDDTVLAGTGEHGPAAWVSPDGGRTWEAAAGLPEPGEDGGWTPVWSDGRRFWAYGAVDESAAWDPEICYADADACGRTPDAPLLVGVGDGEWSAAAFEGTVTTLAGTADGRVLALGESADGVFVATLPAGTAPPVPPLVPEPERVEVRVLEDGETPEVGVRYNAPMYVHCGMGLYRFGEQWWVRTDDGIDVETGAGDEVPEEWGSNGQLLLGFATLIDPDHLEYSLADGTVIATYEKSDQGVGCA